MGRLKPTVTGLTSILANLMDPFFVGASCMFSL